MEFYLISGSKTFQLPVPPSELEVDTGNNVQTVDIYNLGEVSLSSRTRLTAISLSSFFPAQNYKFLAYHNLQNPLQSVAMIDKWREKGDAIRFKVTDTADTYVDDLFIIEGFKYKWQAGTNDIDFTIDLKQYIVRNSATNNPQASSKYSASNKNKAYTRPSNKTSAIPSSYIVKKGDTLTSISKKLYGTTTKWRDIANKNNIKNPDKIYVGQKLVI